MLECKDWSMCTLYTHTHTPTHTSHNTIYEYTYIQRDIGLRPNNINVRGNKRVKAKEKGIQANNVFQSKALKTRSGNRQTLVANV